ncbi:response regulator transcription factor [Allosphingosinicella deserti]|uniref:Response regulator n=1 Tax=Allosphingosinicella deserti TaxID=2116704 RepID=A0A2P7QVW4_9SPHN|nr:response regulator [Sphingomonas deserti]PSJ42107.1 response regulator [Sphingomonas deserti]
MGISILVCDDDDLLIDLIDYRLSSRGYDVVIANDGSEALKRIADAIPDAIILDAMMPVIDGYEVLRRLRENEATKSVPVIMLTARKQEQDIVSALELGANDYLVKPFIPEELVARLSRLLEGQK